MRNLEDKLQGWLIFCIIGPLVRWRDRQVESFVTRLWCKFHNSIPIQSNSVKWTNHGTWRPPFHTRITSLRVGGIKHIQIERNKGRQIGLTSNYIVIKRKIYNARLIQFTSIQYTQLKSVTTGQSSCRKIKGSVL